MSKPFHIARQPDETTCGPTCLAAIYHHFNDPLPLNEVIDGVQMLQSGGTLAPYLGIHALKRGYAAKIYSFNAKIFDPSWFKLPSRELRAKLASQARLSAHNQSRYRASYAYYSFLEHGGEIIFTPPTLKKLKPIIAAHAPLIMGVSGTVLYTSIREHPITSAPDDLVGVPFGHFVVAAGLSEEGSNVHVADPFFPNPLSPTALYAYPMDELLAALLLGVITYDANLLIIKKRLKP